MRRALVVALLVAAAACGGVEETVSGLRDRIESIEIEPEAVLESVRDCDRISTALVGAVRAVADQIDGAGGDGLIPATEIRELVDRIAVSRYYEIAERIGCARLALELDTLDRLRDVNPTTPTGRDFLEEIRRQVEAAG